MTTPSFGTMIRAARLGWGLAREHGCFIRMSDAGESRSQIELCPLNEVPSKKSLGGHHRVWWESPDILKKIPWLIRIRKVHKYIVVIVDDEGAIVR